MKKSISFFTAAALFAAMLILITAAALPESGVFASAAPSVMTAVQTEKVEYCAVSYVTRFGGFHNFSQEGFENALYSSLEFRLDGVIVEVPPDAVAFSSIDGALTPDVYSDDVTVTYGGEEYGFELKFTVSKKQLIVRALINGEQSAVIEEGDSYLTSVVYDGFAGSDTAAVLDAPAIIQREPKMPTPGYTIVPEYAQSALYEFVYVGARIVINANPDTQKTYSVNGEDILLLTGSFSPYYVLEYSEVGINAASSEYAAMSEKIDRYYGSNRIFEEYRQSDAYKINLYLDGEYAELNDPINLRIKLDPKLTGKKDYLVIHFANDGAHELLKGTETDGYLSVNTVDLGEFVLLTPIEGANTVIIVAICVGVVGLAALGVLLGAIFRRKY